MPNDVKQHEQDRRYLAVGYGDEKEIEKSMTEEEWLAKEKKEIEEVEKTVNIRFANYTTLMRAQTLTQGLSAQLQMFLSNMGGSKKEDDGFSAKLLEKAGIKLDPSSEAKKRDLSPQQASETAEPEAEEKKDDDEKDDGDKKEWST